MTLELAIVLVLTVGALLLLATERLRVDVISVAVMSTLLVTGILTPSEGLQGFANEATVTIGAMFVLSEGMRRTGSLNTVASLLGRLFARNYTVGLLVMMTTVAIVSAFINNVAVVAIMLPVLLGLCRKMGFSPTKMLMPLSFAAMFGGTGTLLGTSSNLLVSSVMTEYGLEPMAMFEMTIVGVAFFVVGTIYVMTVGQWLLPERDTAESLETSYELKEYLTEVELLPEHRAVGEMACDFYGHSRDTTVIDVFRQGTSRADSLKELVLQPHDIIRVTASAATVRDMALDEDLQIRPSHEIPEREYYGKDQPSELFEVVIAPDSVLAGRTLRDAGFKRYSPAKVIAIRRSGHVVLVNHLRDVKLKGGDVLLMEAPREKLPGLQQSPDFIVVSEVGLPEYKQELTVPVLVLLVTVVALAAFEILPIVSLAVAAATVLVISPLLTIEEAYEAVDWQVIFLLGGFIPLGVALETTGGIELLADGLLQGLSQFGPVVLLGGFYFFTNFLTAVISNQATVVLLTPVAVTAAVQMGVDPRPLVFAVAFASSTSFATPIGYHTNVMIYSAGNYRFMDFVKIGTPLNLLFLVMATVLIPLVWPL